MISDVTGSGRYSQTVVLESCVLPSPDAVEVADFVFTSTLYPLDDGTGHVVEPDAKSPFIGPSRIELQAHQTFDRLERVLKAAGSTLSDVLRCEVMLADERDFYDFSLVWRERFPTDPPARTTFVVGDRHLLPGVAVGLQAVALKTDSRLERRTIRSASAHDTLAAEHCSQAISAGDYVFPSGIPGISSYETGIPSLPNSIGSQADVQTESVMENLSEVLSEAGTSLENCIKSQNIMADTTDWFNINTVWGRYMKAPPPPRSSIAVESLVVPDARVAANVMAVIPSDENRKEEVRAGLRYHVSEQKINFSPAVATRDFLSLAGHLAYDYATFSFLGANERVPHLASDIEVQVDAIMSDRAEILDANGSAVGDVFEAKVFLTEPRRDFRGFERAWKRWFPDPARRPALHVIPTKRLMMDERLIVEIELMAVRAGAEPIHRGDA